MKRLFIVLAAAFLLVPHQVQADGGKIYLPIITVDKPDPYDVEAKDVVLSLADMPTGYSLTASEPKSGGGTVSAWEVLFEDDSVFSRAYGVANTVAVYQDRSAAVDRFHKINFDGYSQVSMPSIGERSKGFTKVEDGARFYFLVYQQGNVISLVGTVALVSRADFDTSYEFLETSYGKLLATGTT